MNVASIAVAIHSVKLNVLETKHSILEPGSGSFTTATSCFSANISHPLNRDAEFKFVPSNLTTATPDVDFQTNGAGALLTIPMNFSGDFLDCVDIAVIIGDDSLEENELVVYELRAVSPLDRVFPPNSSTLVFYIVNNNTGKSWLISSVHSSATLVHYRSFPLLQLHLVAYSSRLVWMSKMNHLLLHLMADQLHRC